MAQQYQVDIVTRVVGASKIAQLEAALDKLAKNASKADKKADEVADSLARLRKAAAQAAAAANKKQKAIKNLGNGLQSLATKVATAYGAFQLFNKAIASAGARDAAEQRLKNLTSSTAEYETALLAAKVASQRFGQTQTEATQAFADTLSRLKGLGFGLKEVNDIYTGFNTIARQAGVATQDAAGAFLQLSQALGSGTLQGDELRSILERMPQLGVEIRDALGPEGASGSIKDLASSGKLTGDVILKAMQNAAKGADDLDSKITSQQLTMERAKQAADQFFVAMGRAFAPAFLAIVQQLTYAMGFIGSLLSQAATAAADNAEAIGLFAVNALRLGAVVAVILSVVKGIQLIKKALDAAKAAQIAFMALAGPKAWALIAAGIGVAAATTYGLAKANEAVDKAIEDATEQAKLQGDQAVRALNEQIQAYSGLNGKQQQSKVTKEQEAKATKALAAAQREYQAALGSEQGDIDRKLQVTQAILNAEKQINDAKLQQANADLQSATSLGEKESAIQRIYAATVANAKLEYEATIAAAQAEQQKVEAALRHAEVLEKQIKAEVALQRSKGISNQAQKDALQNANELVATAQKNLQAQEMINEAVRTGAQATLDKQLTAAKVTMEMQKQTAQQDQTNSAISRGADEMGRLADNASRASSAAASVGAAAGAGSTRRGGTHTVDHSGNIYDRYKLGPDGRIVETTAEDRLRQMNSARIRTANAADRQAQMWDLAYAGTNYGAYARAVSGNGGMMGVVGSQMYEAFRGLPGHRDLARLSTINELNSHVYSYADGGYVTGPQQAVVGEGGEPEYIIPASKMSQAMSRYSSGMRGESVIPKSATVNVSYNGSTVNMGGSDYIKRDDVPGLLSSAVNQTLTTLKKSPRARLESGLR